VRHILIIFSIFLFSLTIISCSRSSDDDPKGTAPVIAEVTKVTTPTNDNTPNYTFSSTETGTISYGGSCSSSTTSATSDNNTITFNALAAGTYSNCTITVTDSAGNASSTLSVNTFVVDTTAPTVSSVSTTADNQSLVSITDNITVTFSEAMEPSYITTSTSDTYCAGTIRVSSDNFISCVRMSSEPASSNSNKTLKLMNDLNAQGEFKLEKKELKKIKENFCSESLSVEETKSVIKEVYKNQKMLIDPHTAVAIGAVNKISLEGNSIYLATAHPSKFSNIVMEKQV